jgi:DNA-binding helix-hairpin-helix protein with protein kinase domain
MPRYSERKVLIRDLQFLLVTTFANLETAKRQYQISLPRSQSTLSLLGLLGMLRKTKAQPEGIIFIAGLVLARHLLKTRFEIWKHQRQNLEHLITYSQASAILESIDHVCRKRYLQRRVCQPRIASLGRTFEVLWSTSVFQRWVRNHSCLYHWKNGLLICFPLGPNDPVQLSEASVQD